MRLTSNKKGKAMTKDNSIRQAGMSRRYFLQVTGEREVPSRMIGEAVMAKLRELDEVAYVRFASVYRSFQDLSEFQDELNRLSALKPNEAED